MKSKRLLILLLMALLVPWAANAQITATCYPPTETYATGYTDGSTKTSGDMHTESSGGVQGWMKFDVSSIPDDATINSITLKFYCTGSNGPYVKLTSAGELDPATASASDLYAAITNATPNYYTSTYMSSFTVNSWKTVALSAAAISKLQENGLTNDYFTLGFYEYESGYSTVYYLYAAGYNATNKPYLEVSYTVTTPYVTLSPTAATVFTGYTETLTATPENVTGTPTITYTSSDTDVATVSGSGTTATVTGVAPGTATITATMNYEGTNYTATCAITVEDPHHCIPTLTSTTTSYYISNFTTTGGVSNINNTTTGAGHSYSDFYDTYSASAYEGLTINFTITIAGGGTHGSAMWIDWNNDFEFDEDERVYHTTGYLSSPHSGSFTVPENAILGDHRMRIVSDFSGSNPSNPCSASTGEFEDYKLTITSVPDCMPVNALTVNEPNVTATQIPISWTAGSTEDSWNIRWRKYGTTDTYSTATVAITSYTISELTANTKYEFGVQAGCDTLNFWTEDNYTTACGIETSIHEKFDSYTGTTSGSTNNLPHCWDYYNGTTYSYGAGYPLIYNGSSYSGSNHLRFYSYYSSSYTNTDQYAILPAVVNVSAMRISLYASLYTSYYYGSTTTYPGELVVGVMTDDDLTTFTAVDTIKPTSSYKPFTVNLDSYTGTGNRIALKMTPATSNQTYRYVMVDNLVVEVIPDCETPTGLALKSGSQTPEGATIVWNPGNASSWFVEYKKNSESEYTAIATPVADTFYTFMGLDANTPYNARIKVNCTTGTGITYPTDPVSFTTAKACPAPKNLVVSNVTGTSATLAWTPGYNETEWTVKYKVSDSATYITAPTVSGTPTINLTGLGSGTTYDVQIIGCDEANVYTVTRAFTTAFTAPYLQAFAASSIPAGWNNYSTLLSPEVLNGTTPLSGSGSWNFSTTYVFGAYHAKLNIYGDNCKSWLLTPNIVVGSGQVLSFDLALTDYDNANPIEDTTAQSDDKFIVLVSTNNGTTWSILRQWDNAGSQYVYNRIATAGETVYIDMAGFSGQTVRVAFYGESTIAGNGDNDLHIDNVSIDLPPTCYRPIGLTASDVTNHSAKLSWTPGIEDQTAWQIAYRKGTTFNPADTTLDWTTVTTVDVTTNPYTFVKTLDPASTYYMYVRANCGDGDYSEWCRKVCSFTTKAAAPAPTNFQKTDVGPDYALLTWKAGGGDFEANYDLYVVQSATTPATPTIDTVPTIAGITELPTAENPYLLGELDNEKIYYAWVRANHVHPDTTMHSAWVAISGRYFTTLVNCPIPTTANVTNLTPHSATLNWTGYSESYNVQYRTAGIADYSEDFSGQTPVGYSSSNGQLPEGWHSFNSSSSGYAPRVSDGTNYTYISMTGNYLLMTTNGSDQSTYAIMPQIEGIDSVAFKYKYENTSYGTFTVGYVTNNTGYSTYVPLQTPTKTTTVSTYTLTADDITTINNANGYIAFRYVAGTSTYYSVGIDDIFVKVSNTTPAGEWIAANNGEPIDGTSVDIVELADNTKYEWQVQANCANDWSASAYFTTPWACTAPVADSATNITYNSADLYWTGYQDEYNVRYRTAEDADVFLQTGYLAEEYNYSWAYWTSNNIGEQTGIYWLDNNHITIGWGFAYDATHTPQYVISHEMAPTISGTVMSFYAAKRGNTEEVLKVGFSSTDNAIASFTWNEEPVALTTSGGYFGMDVPEGTKYVAFQYVSGEDLVLFTEVIVYANYVPAGEWEYANGVTSPTTIDELVDGVWYEWQVQGLGECTEGTDWSESDYFQTQPFTQTIELKAGWNWVSFYVEKDDPVDLLVELEEALGDKAEMISSSEISTEYDGEEWFGDLDFEGLTNEQMYMILVNEDCTVQLQGIPANPADHVITIKPGWNWIGYPSSEEVDVMEALADFEAVEEDALASPDGITEFDGEEWFGDFDAMIPGQGYMYLSNSDEEKELEFQTTTRRTQSISGKFMPQPLRKNIMKVNFRMKGDKQLTKIINKSQLTIKKEVK